MHVCERKPKPYQHSVTREDHPGRDLAVYALEILFEPLVLLRPTGPVVLSGDLHHVDVCVVKAVPVDRVSTRGNYEPTRATKPVRIEN